MTSTCVFAAGEWITYVRTKAAGSHVGELFCLCPLVQPWVPLTVNWSKPILALLLWDSHSASICGLPTAERARQEPSCVGLVENENWGFPPAFVSTEPRPFLAFKCHFLPSDFILCAFFSIKIASIPLTWRKQSWHHRSINCPICKISCFSPF